MSARHASYRAASGGGALVAEGAAVLTVLDLFSGIGGFSLGLERTGGFRTIAFCEIDPFCRKVLAKHWPGVPIHDDAEAAQYDGRYDVVTAGWPCQDISNAVVPQVVEVIGRAILEARP